LREYQGVWVPNLSALPRRQGGFDLDGDGFAERVVAVAAPGPVFRSRDQSAMDGVAVNVLQFLDTLLGSTHVEVVIPLLPKVLGASKLLGAPHKRFSLVWVFLLE
jgi:hypothetical protein